MDLLFLSKKAYKSSTKIEKIVRLSIIYNGFYLVCMVLIEKVNL